jgi:hypothetical protein
MRQAVVIIHGIGEQRPMETLRAFVAGALKVNSKCLSAFVFSKPDRISDTLELRRLSASTKTNVKESPLNGDCDTDFYELYWQHLMQGTSWLSVWPWVLDLLCSQHLTDRLRSVRRRFLGIIGLVLVAITVLATVLWPILDSSPLWQWAATPVIFSLSLAGVFGWLLRRPLKSFVLGRTERFLLGYVGDAARYLTPDPPNIEARRNIRTAGLNLLRGLHEDELRRYERIILVGHSLGSVIAYDLITWFWQEQHNRLDLTRLTGERKTVAMTHAELPSEDKSWLKELGDPYSDDFPNRQRALWQKLKDQHTPWRITDLVTLGSPLAHANVLFAKNDKAFCDAKRQRELPTCPPQREDCRDDGLLWRKIDGVNPAVRILHHGAPFAITRWTNLYFPGDIIGGPVADLFGSGIKDVELCPALREWPDSLFPARSHTRYWELRECHACSELFSALNLNEGEPPLPQGSGRAHLNQ